MVFGTFGPLVITTCGSLSVAKTLVEWMCVKMRPPASTNGITSLELFFDLHHLALCSRVSHTDRCLSSVAYQPTCTDKFGFSWHGYHMLTTFRHHPAIIFLTKPQPATV